MNGFLDTLGRRLAEQWFSLLVLPGVLWVAAALIAGQLGQRQALEPRALIDGINSGVAAPQSTGVAVLIVSGLLVVAAGAGLAATGLGALVRRLWTARGRWWPARWLTGWRQGRWRRADEKVSSLVAESIRAAQQAPAGLDDSNFAAEPQLLATGPAIAEALARRDSICLEFPDRHTWIGDRWQANARRIHRTYGLDVTVAWPRLWTVLPEPLRTDLATAQASCTAAATLTGWAVLYGVLGIRWWPALLISAAILAAGLLRSRTATTTLCVLVETAVDLHGHTLAEQLRKPCPGPVTFAIGNEINTLLRKDPPTVGRAHW